MKKPRIYSQAELLNRKFAQIRKTKKDWTCQCCTVTITKFDENETSWTADRSEMIRLCLQCVSDLKEPPAASVHDKILEIAARQAKIAKLYVLMTNVGEELKREYKFPSGSPARLENATERYFALIDGILEKTENLKKIKAELSSKKI